MLFHGHCVLVVRGHPPSNFRGSLAHASVVPSGRTAADVVDEVRIVFECAAVKDVLKLVPADIDTSLPYRLSNTFEKFLADHFEELG